MYKLLFLVFCCLFLYGCGGGSGGSKSPPHVMSSKSQTLSSSVSSSYSSLSSLASSSANFTEVVYNIEEDQSLTIQANSDFGLTNVNWEVVGGPEYLSLAGGLVTPSYLDKSMAYHPKEDFFGTDEFYYVDDRSTFRPQRIKVVINVTATEDKLAKWHLSRNQVFKSKQSIEIPFPRYPDTGEVLAPDDSMKLTLDGQSLPYQLMDKTIKIEIPVVERAGVYDLSLYQEREGELALEATTSLVIAVSKGNLTYYMGNENTQGSLLVMVRTALVNNERYQAWIKENLVPFLLEPMVADYQQYWNFVVVEPSVERKITLYGNIAVADPGYYSAVVSQYVPTHTEIIVLDGENFRATGGYPVTMNVSNDKGVLFHEIGHAHAKLGDEYAEECTTDYSSDFYPNVEKSYVGVLDYIQWKHWVEDPFGIPGQSAVAKNDTDIGVFLGAFYCLNKYYRPASATLMRNPLKPLSAVDKEAWVLANYENLGLLGSIKSEKKNNVNRIKIEKQFDGALTTIRWFLNDNELPEFSGAHQIEIDESLIEKTHYSVTAELIDLTGLVRNSHAYFAFNELVDDGYSGYKTTNINATFKKNWTFSKVSPAQQKQSGQLAQLSRQKWVEQGVLIEPGGHRLSGTRRYVAADVIRPVTGASDLVAEVVVGSSVLMAQGIELKRFHIPDIAPPLYNHDHYHLVHPVINGPYQINVYSSPERELVAVFNFSDD